MLLIYVITTLFFNDDDTRKKRFFANAHLLELAETLSVYIVNCEKYMRERWKVHWHLYVPLSVIIFLLKREREREILDCSSNRDDRPTRITLNYYQIEIAIESKRNQTWCPSLSPHFSFSPWFNTKFIRNFLMQKKKGFNFNTR